MFFCALPCRLFTYTHTHTSMTDPVHTNDIVDATTVPEYADGTASAMAKIVSAMLIDMHRVPVSKVKIVHAGFKGEGDDARTVRFVIFGVDGAFCASRGITQQLLASVSVTCTAALGANVRRVVPGEYTHLELDKAILKGFPGMLTEELCIT